MKLIVVHMFHRVGSKGIKKVDKPPSRAVGGIVVSYKDPMFEYLHLLKIATFGTSGLYLCFRKSCHDYINCTLSPRDF